MAVGNRVEAFGQQYAFDGPVAQILGVEGEYCQIQHETMENKAKRRFFSDLGFVCLVWSKNRVCSSFRLFGRSIQHLRRGTGGGNGGERGGTGGNGAGTGGNGGERGETGAGTGGNGGERGRGTGGGTGGTGANGGILGSGLGRRCFGGNCAKKQNASENSWFVPSFTKKSSNCREFRETCSKLGEKARKTPKCHNFIKTRWNGGSFRQKHPNTNIFE